jgi:NAD(P)-dependent dehydrogenase (short-subunit alcohol dehydrogenase family)
MQQYRGLNMLSRVFEQEEGKAHGLRVCTFTPGPTDTSMHVTIREAPINRTVSYQPQALQPAEDTARFLLRPCSDAATDLAGPIRQCPRSATTTTRRIGVVAADRCASISFPRHI